MDHDHGMSGFCVKPRGGAAGGGGSGGGAKCGRWNPTAEQVKVLTDLFRSGLRTPSTDQIQKISSQLSFYGKIESKNVFYWFQNHKARERQKRRRVSLPDHHQHHDQSRREDKVSSAKQPNSISQRKFFTEFVDSNQIPDPAGRVVETLQLFPLSSFGESDSDKFRRLYSSDFKELSETDHHPPLDLRLSFM